MVVIFAGTITEYNARFFLAKQIYERLRSAFANANWRTISVCAASRLRTLAYRTINARKKAITHR